MKDRDSKIKMKDCLFKSVMVFLIMAVSVCVYAETHEGSSHTIPWHQLYPQFFNITIVLALVIFFSRKKLKPFFQEREAKYSDLVTRAEKARNSAESHKKYISEKIEKLDQSASKALELARSEAAEIKGKIILEAQEIAKKMENDARRTIYYEIERIKIDLRNEMMFESFRSAKQILQQDLNLGEQQKLQNDFIMKMQAVK